MTHSYDDIYYVSHAFPESHPDRLATVGRLFGMKPPPVDAARILELGCASGGNLIPLAQVLPHSEFVGIDISERNVADGRQLARALRLQNVTLIQADITNLDDSIGAFDYIICHGTFSWVNREVQESIFLKIRERLSPLGIAYVSYNTYPGWHVRGMLREMMKYNSPNERVTAEDMPAIRALMELVASTYENSNQKHLKPMAHEIRLMLRLPDWFVLHDYLEENNNPCYFHEFAERAEKHGLRYLGDAEMASMSPLGLPKLARDTLSHLDVNEIQREQYIDFLRFQMFRRTLLCHKEVQLNRQIDLTTLSQFRIASELHPEGQAPVLSSPESSLYRARSGTSFRSADPLTKCAIQHLQGLWPRSTVVNELMLAARETLNRVSSPTTPKDDANQDAQRMADFALKGFVGKVLLLSTWEPVLGATIEKCPMTTPLARLQAQQSDLVTNLRHEVVRLDPMALRLVPYLDGKHDCQTLKKIYEKFPAPEKKNDPLPSFESALTNIYHQALIS